MNFSKADFWKAIVAGEAIALLAIPILENIKIFEFLKNNNLKFLFLGLWFIFLPLAAATGLYIVYLFSARNSQPLVFQIGKYGIIGLLNTFLILGIINFLILITGIARGLRFDFFAAIAFWFGVTNSFFWNKSWTFEADKTVEVKKTYAKFLISTGTVALVSLFLIHILINAIGPLLAIEPKVWVNIVFFSFIPVSFFANFFSYKAFVFKSKFEVK